MLKIYLLLSILFISPSIMLGQNIETKNIQAKAIITGDLNVRIRWAPANTKAWVDGRKYGYSIERYTLLKDTVWQENPEKFIIDNNFKPKPLPDWEDQVIKSDYAAVIAQAFYGDEFSLNSPSSNVGNIINQATELEQRFTTSVFMAEYDYEAAVLAGWGWNDTDIKVNEKYLYRIYLNRPQKMFGDTAVVYIGMDDLQELPKPIGLTSLFGDKSVLLSWNYNLLSDFYHSYHIERKSTQDGNFERITHLPVTVLNTGMQEIFYTDSLPNNNVEYMYRVVGLTGFGELGPVSDTVKGYGQESITCVPQILSGYFTEEKEARVFWEFECPQIDLVEKLQIRRSPFIDGEYEIIEDNVPLHLQEQSLLLEEPTNYIKIYVFNKDGSKKESFPFQLNKIDSIPPSVPTGLEVIIDSAGVAYLSWNVNTELDMRGYRILRSFTKEGEKSSISPDLITKNYYTDSLSLRLSNPEVYYSVTAVDIRYNESEPSPSVAAKKPNIITLAKPVITGYNIEGNKVTVSWLTNTKIAGITYSLIRSVRDKEEYNKTIFEGNGTKNTYTDEIPVSGQYRYIVVANSPAGNKSVSPQPLILDITKDNIPDGITGLNSYVDRNNRYIELSWKKNANAQLYRIYKKEEGKKAALWKEVVGNINRITDDMVSPNTRYIYTILLVSTEGRMSSIKEIEVDF